MSIQFQCVHCLSSVRATARRAGKHGRCPCCGLVTPVPAFSTTPHVPILRGVRHKPPTARVGRRTSLLRQRWLVPATAAVVVFAAGLALWSMTAASGRERAAERIAQVTTPEHPTIPPRAPSPPPAEPAPAVPVAALNPPSVEPQPRAKPELPAVAPPKHDAPGGERMKFAPAPRVLADVPAARPDPALAMDMLAAVVRGRGVPQAAVYRRTNDIHPAWILAADGSVHPWNDEMPPEWRAGAVEETELVAVVGPERRSVLSTHAYTDDLGRPAPTVTRYRTDLMVRVVAARTGKLVAQRNFFTIPRAVGSREAYDLTVLAEPVSFAHVQGWLSRLVSPAHPLPDLAMDEQPAAVADGAATPLVMPAGLVPAAPPASGTVMVAALGVRTVKAPVRTVTVNRSVTSSIVVNRKAPVIVARTPPVVYRPPVVVYHPPVMRPMFPNFYRPPVFVVQQRFWLYRR